MIPKGTAKKPLSVGGITNIVKALLEVGLFNVWVEGELTEVKLHRSTGHVYLTLKDKSAQLSGVIWRSAAERMRFQPGPGVRVVAFGRLSVYAPQGKYQLVITKLQPAGEGARQAALEALTRKLEAEGLFEPSRRRRLPMLPRAVGVVTSGSGAARRDIEAVIGRRSPQIPIVLYPALVQGPGAEADIVAGIEALSARDDVEVIIVGRGGGGVDDLWAFNGESVVRAIVACSVPVISAVGHETDATLADRVADWRAATPSEAAEAAVPVRDDLLSGLAALVDRMDIAVQGRLSLAQQQHHTLTERLGGALGFDRRRVVRLALAARLDQAMAGRLARSRETLRGAEVKLGTAHPARRTAEARARLTALVQRLIAAPTRRLQQAERQYRARVERLDPLMAEGMARRRAQLGSAAARLDALSPLAVLGRGYSITRHGGRVVRDATTVPVGTRIEIILHGGRLLADTVPDEEQT